MDERKKSVLHAIIKDYISTGEPVGSRVVAKKYDLGVSPATIRNEMSDLEELGYIQQPHTSAGRMPSEKGYRYYVDHLMEKEELTSLEEEFIYEGLSRQLDEIDSFMRQCCQMISKLTNYAALIMLPSEDKGKLEKIQLVPVDNNQLLMVIISNTGALRHRLLRMPETLEPERISRLEAMLQTRLFGVEMEKLDKSTLSKALASAGRQQEDYCKMVGLMDKILSQSDGEKVFFSGALNILSQPEFKDPEHMRNVLAVLEEDKQLKDLLTIAENRGMQVIIGSEIPRAEMKNCSMILSSYQADGERAGSIGVLGPLRMSYPKTVSLVEFIARELSGLMSGKGG